MNGLAAYADDGIWAVGTHADSDTGVASVQVFHFDGSSWSIGGVGAANNSGLSALWPTATDSFVAVGDEGEYPNEQAIIVQTTHGTSGIVPVTGLAGVAFNGVAGDADSSVLVAAGQSGSGSVLWDECPMPPGGVPEAPVAVALPVVAVALMAGGYALRRRTVARALWRAS